VRAEVQVDENYINFTNILNLVGSGDRYLIQRRLKDNLREE